jgi:hypothetical protein
MSIAVKSGRAAVWTGREDFWTRRIVVEAGRIAVSSPNYLLAIQSKVVHSIFQSSTRTDQFHNFFD